MYLRLYEETILLVSFLTAQKEPGAMKNSLWVTSGIMFRKELGAIGGGFFLCLHLKDGAVLGRNNSPWKTMENQTDGSLG